ncbi:MAG: HAMP domain-containing histidine kinase [Pirellulales bacterium]|nr:HAMP domain-containing histidine kinase [Pirellulales bacterium]
MADASADALTSLLLLGNTTAVCQALADALAMDPPLVLWTVCVADGRAGFRPGSVDELVGWLAEHGLEVLCWEAAPEASPEAAEIAQPPPEAKGYADQVAARLELADLARRLAGQQPAASPELAFLLGLLDGPCDWLPTADASSSATSSADGLAEQRLAGLPQWLVHLDDLPEAVAVRLAGDVLAGEVQPPQSVEIYLQACRDRAAEGRRRWLAPVAGAGRWLPLLAARMARLSALENRFDEILEAEKLEAMAEFAAGAGHEINNPLTVIAGRAQLFLREEQDPERRRALALMNTQAKRVYEMIADMMLFARPPQPEPELLDVVELIDRVVADLASQAARQETTLCRTGDDGPLQLEVDGAQLTVALRAMCQNALEAIGREGRIEVGARRRELGVEIHIADNGPGIPPEERRHLFDPYYSARQAGRGLGLGLSKAWRIVTNHGGRIEVVSEPGQGATFAITLPG